MTLEQIVGAALLLLFLADIFLTVLYARAGTGLLAPRWNRLVWTTVRAVSALSGGRRRAVLSVAGPLIVILLIGFWSLGLAIGAALIIQPELGTAIRPSTGQATTGFATALLVAGNSLSIVGGGDYSPYTDATRFLYLVNSLIGASVLSLVLSYLVQVYSALRERNALALTIDLMTDGTGDAAVMLARLMPDGDGGNAATELGSLVRSLAATKEAHHFYPLLFYFRFEEPRYAVPRFSFVLLDLAALVDAALDTRQYRSLTGSAAIASLRQATLLILELLDGHLAAGRKHSFNAEDAWQYRQRYAAATRHLADAGIVTQSDGVERYVASRSEWMPLVRRVARAGGDTMRDIDSRTPENRA